MFSLDIYTIYFLTFLGNFFMFLMLVIFAQTTGFDGLMRHYIYGKLLQTLGGALGLFRGLVPVDFSIIMGNSLIFLGVAVEVYCIVHVGRIPLNKSIKRWRYVVAGIIAGFTLLYLAGATMGVRVFVSAMILAIYSLVAAAGLFFRSDATKLRKILALFFVALAAYQVLRALDAWPRGEHYVLFATSSSQAISFVSLYIHMLISTMAYLLVSREVIDIKLKEAATKDYLTGIYNRRQFIQLAEKLVSLMIRQQKPVTVFMIDFDYFKTINDTYGHAVGDNVLVQFSRGTEAIIRQEDLFGRYGGEEFIVFSPNTSTAETLMIGQRIREVCAISSNNNPDIPKHTVSIGTATMIPETYADLEYLIRQADQALFQAKRNGRDQIVQADIE
ncbi:GGDEF domain-containing protein [Propionispora hippei]|uniref:Diguanylate cyclase (GGDEF) domain-containing protein n=1 Tax=Propionispora hippei DSM 15287 TaxID=1123003 RepID=A0A1M6KFB9_9FIRM|nr:GGDEF domain-containing protein [Propionispora hippei]SHJ57685.1 diguanylate cyclase (GGDEF) domain-containing protein [Propionispora hippei DSM 15287]